jgi:transcriptional regulator with XRE-family HTH domain
LEGVEQGAAARLPPPVQQAILAYARAAGLARRPEEAVFPSRWRDQPVDGKYIGGQLRQAAQLAGMGERSPRQRRTALGWTLEHVAAQAQVSVGLVSLIETGERRPSLRSWERIRQTLGHQRAAARGGLHPQPREISDELVAALGPWLAAERQASLAKLASATGAPVTDVRLAPRRLAEQLEPTGMLVFIGPHGDCSSC